MPRKMRIDFISDIACPWCVIGLRSLEAALEQTGDLVDAEFHFQPFELNPDAPRGGWDQAARFAEKYGWSPDQVRGAQANVRERAAATGFAMNYSEASRTYNTFDAHRLLHWAEAQGKQPALKHALFTAYFTDARDVSDPDVLVEVAASVGLDGDAARELLATDRYATEVRTAEGFWQSRGVNSVPTIVIDRRHVLVGGQPVETFEQVIRQIAAQAAA